MDVIGVSKRYKVSIMDESNETIPPIVLSTVETSGDEQLYIILAQNTESITLSTQMAVTLDESLHALVSHIPN